MRCAVRAWWLGLGQDRLEVLSKLGRVRARPTAFSFKPSYDWGRAFGKSPQFVVKGEPIPCIEAVECCDGPKRSQNRRQGAQDHQCCLHVSLTQLFYLPTRPLGGSRATSPLPCSASERPASPRYCSPALPPSSALTALRRCAAPHKARRGQPHHGARVRISMLGGVFSRLNWRGEAGRIYRLPCTPTLLAIPRIKTSRAVLDPPAAVRALTFSRHTVALRDCHWLAVPYTGVMRGRPRRLTAVVGVHIAPDTYAARPRACRLIAPVT